MITQLLRSRSSARRFEDRPVPDDVLAEILEAGRLSPSGGNEQPWAFGVVTEPALIAQIAEAARGQTWIAKAPLLVVLCVTIVSDERGGRDIQVHRFPEYAEVITGMDKGLYSALNQEEHQTKIAGAHMALAALKDVGLPEGTMGNSEVGHLNIGAGRIVFQDVVNVSTREENTNHQIFNSDVIECFI